MTTSAVVLFSGGQDSTTCLYWAKRSFDIVYALSIFYGQRHEDELSAARAIAQRAFVPHQELDARVLGQLTTSSALAGSGPARAKPIAASGGFADAAMPEGLPTSFVPGRNLLFLTLAGIHAVNRGAKHVVTGVCETDYSGYPDCREDFVLSFERTLNLAMPSSAGPLRVHAPLMHLSKKETVEMARGLDGCWGALALSVTCYEGQHPGCGVCPACVLRAKGFAAAGVADPAQAA